MLDEQEWARLGLNLGTLTRRVRRYRREDGIGLAEAKMRADQEALDVYCAITGFRETTINAVWHHRLSLYGPPCHACGKPLRTPKAKLCAACGAAAEAGSMATP